MVRKPPTCDFVAFVTKPSPDYTSSPREAANGRIASASRTPVSRELDQSPDLTLRADAVAAQALRPPGQLSPKVHAHRPSGYPRGAGGCVGQNPILRYGTVPMPMSQSQPAVPSGTGFLVEGMAIYEET